ncbi:MAG: AMP-binding protein, partial [Halioglobus sp.]
MSEGTYQPRTVPQVVADAAAAQGDRIAITDGGVNLTYTELDAARVQSAQAFIAAGVGKGDRVAIWAPNIYRWILAAIGAQTIGAVVVPLNTRYKGPEAAYVLNASGARLLFTVGDFLGVSYPDLLKDQDLPHLERMVTLSGEAAGTLGWDDFLAAGQGVAVSEVTARA